LFSYIWHVTVAKFLPMTKKEKITLEEKIASGQPVTINERILKMMYGSSYIEGIKSVITPSAQYTTLREVPGGAQSITEPVLSQRESIMRVSPKLWFLIHFMLFSGVRVSEALSISTNRISSNGAVRIKGLKGSDDRIIFDAESSQFFIDCKNSNVSPFRDFDRHFLYRFLKERGIYMQIEGTKKNAVTHAFRHNLLNANQEIDSDLSLSKKQIGHKSIESTKSYVKDNSSKLTQQKGDSIPNKRTVTNRDSAKESGNESSKVKR